MGSVTPCTTPSALDANARGVVAGAQTLVTVTPAQWTRGVALPSSTGCGPDGGGDRQLVVRYVPRSNGFLTARLTVADDAPRGTDLVGRLLLLDGCGAATQRLACAGRIETEGGLFASPRTLVSPARLTAGRAVYLVATGDAVAATLQITEVGVSRRLGDVCDPSEHGDRCPAGSTCASAPTRECRPDGGEGTRCRRVGSPCEPGLTCFFATPEGYAGVCLRRVAPGAACGAGDWCLDEPCVPGPGARCPAVGSLFGPCRAAEPRCDAGLTCPDAESIGVQRCVRAVAAGERCSPARPESACVAGASCVLAGASWRCVRDGAAAGRCREVAPRCDASLVCASGRGVCEPSAGLPGMGAACALGPERCAAALRCFGGRCLPLGAAGEPCTLGEGAQCAEGATCVTARVSGTDGVARCVRDGASGGACRAGAAPCDGGLPCNGLRRCASWLAQGAACGAQGECGGGARCEGTCRADGAERGWCRLTAPFCDAGLACASGTLGAPPLCARVAPLGQACADDGAVSSVCPIAAECSWTDPRADARCIARSTTTIACFAEAGGPAACPSGTSCARGLCRAEVPPGVACGPSVTCVRGASCVPLAAPPGRAECRMDGGAGGACRTTGVACDAGLQCLVQADGARRCVAAVALGAPCPPPLDRSCVVGAACVGGVCRALGTMGAPCREEGGACEAGLACNVSACQTAATRGAPCDSERACASPLACAAAGSAAPTCGDGRYAVTVRGDVAFEEPCVLPIVEPSTPLSVRVFGEVFDVLVSAAGEAHLRARTPRSLSSVAAGVRDAERVVLDDPMANAICARIDGVAPRRRVPNGGGRWRSDALPYAPALASEVILYEGSDAVEFRLRPSPIGVAPPTYVRAGVAVESIGSFTTPAVRNLPGTSITLTPR